MVQVTTSYALVVGTMLAALRKARGLDQGTFAAAMGLGQSSWSRIEHGVTSLSIDHLVGACRQLAVDPAEFVRVTLRVAADLETEGVAVEYAGGSAASEGSTMPMTMRQIEALVPLYTSLDVLGQ